MKPTKQERIEKSLEFLKGHFDGVIIIATNHEDGETQAYSEQDGNYHAVEGAVQSWLNGDDIMMEDF